MEGCWCQVNGQANSVEIFLPWSTEGQGVNNNGVCLPGKLDQNLSVESGSVFSSVRRDELPVQELMPEPVVIGCSLGRIIRDRKQTESVEAFCTLPRGIMGSWRRKVEEVGVFGVSDETTPTHRLLTHSRTHPHTDTVDSQVICLVIEQM